MREVDRVVGKTSRPAGKEVEEYKREYKGMNKRWREVMMERSGASRHTPPPKRFKNDESEQEVSNPTEGRQLYNQVEEMMIGTPAGPGGNSGRRIKKARRGAGLKQPDKGRIMNQKLNILTKEWTGKVKSGKKRKAKEVEGAQADTDGMYTEAGRPWTQFGGDTIFGRLMEGGKILEVEGARPRVKKRKTKIQSNLITNYFGNPEGIHLGSQERVQKLDLDSKTLSVKPSRPLIFSVFDKGGEIKL